jgi:major type 1 subunit fimbrin (pilin)
MKKILLTASLLTAFGVAAVAPQVSSAAGANSGTITINGTLTASTCTVSINGNGASPTVTLPNTPLVMGTLSTAGASTGWTQVQLTLSGCTALNGYANVYPYFTSTNIDSTTGFLKNAGGSATNVEIALSNQQSTTGALTLQSASGAQNAGSQSITAANPTFTYYAGYVATGGASTAGSVTTTVQYSLNYQ